MGSSESQPQKPRAVSPTPKRKSSVKRTQDHASTRVVNQNVPNLVVLNPLMGRPLPSTNHDKVAQKQSKALKHKAKNAARKSDPDDYFCHGGLSTTNTNSSSQPDEADKIRIIELNERVHENNPPFSECASELQQPMNIAKFRSDDNENTFRTMKPLQDENSTNGDDKHLECTILEVETPSDVESWSSISDDIVNPITGRSIQTPNRLSNTVSESHTPSLCLGPDNNDKTLPQNIDITDDDDDVLTQDECHMDARQNSTKLTQTTNITISNADSVDSSSVHGLARFSSQNIHCHFCGLTAEVYPCQQYDGVNLCKDCAAESIIGKKRPGSNHGMMCLQESHTNNSRWNSESSASTINTEAVSSLLYDPCSVCGRVIEDIEQVHRCGECDFIVCPDCYGTVKVVHEHELRSFRRISRSNIQELTPLSNWSRKSGGNRIINNYVIIRQLGQGSYAKVKLVQNVQTGELFALKILRRPRPTNLLNRVKPHSSDDDLLREVAVMKYIEHPNIVKLIEVIEDVEGGGRLYLIMEYCQLGPVHQLGAPPLSLEKVRQFGRGILSGLLYLHSEFLYHRDIKPANCLVAAGGAVKLADFGTCNSRQHSTGVDGTPAFNCPEILHGEDTSGEIADSWAFALTLYQMASGTLPCEGMSTLGYRGFIRSSDPIPIPSPSKENSIDMSLYDLLSKMLNKDPKQRMLLSKAVHHPFFQLDEDEIQSMLQKHYSDVINTENSYGPSESQTQPTSGATPASNRVNLLYDKALKSVKCGRNLPEAFHGIKDIHMIHRKELQAAEGMSTNTSDVSIVTNRLSKSLSTSLSRTDTTEQQADPSQFIDLQSIQERIGKQKRQCSQTLDLTNIRMGAPPVFVNDVAPFTTRMRFTSNHLRRLAPISFSDFTQLKEIAITCNHLERFPEEVLATPHLSRLDLSYNRITNLPSLAKAAFLEQLNLHSNNISGIGLDNETGCSVLVAPNLKQVRLSSNPIRSLPMGLETLHRLNLVLDSHPDLCTQWARIVEERNHSKKQPSLFFIVWDDYFPALVAGVDLPIWIASSNLQLYRLQTLQTCECRNVVLFRSASPWFPIGRITGEKLSKHFREIDYFQHNNRKKNRASGDTSVSAEVASTVPSLSSLPPIVRFSALSYVKEYFFISDNEEDSVGGYCSLFNFISETLRKNEPIMFFMMCAYTSMQHTREIAIAALSEYLVTLSDHGTLKEKFDAVVASMRNLL